jgi:zinc protease
MAVTRWKCDVFLALLCGAALASAQPPKPAALTAEQILERSIAATGGREAIEKVTSTQAKGTLEIGTQHMHAAIELYAKAPAQRLIVTMIEGFGEVRQGCDGKTAWTEDPSRGLRELAGAEKDETLRECAFNAELKWRELYPKVVLAGKENVGGRDAYKIVMRPASGKPVTRFFDAETFLLIRQVSSRDTSQGSLVIQADMSDYRDVDGIKMPFLTKQTMPIAEVTIQLLEVKNNVALEDARFAKPATK